MRACTLSTWGLLLILPLGCESRSDADGERTRDEWIVLCESQTNAADCEAVPPASLDGETFRCESLIIVRTSEPDCISTANDSRCFAVSETQPVEPGYILTESGDPQVWLVESPGDVVVHGSAIASCTLAGDGVTWTPDAVCECAGKVTDDEGGW